MVELSEAKQQVQTARQTLQTEQAKTQQAKSALEQLRQKQYSQQALRQQSQGINALAMRRKNLGKIDTQLQNVKVREAAIQSYESPLMEAEQQIAQVEQAQKSAEQAQYDFGQALKVYQGEPVFLLENQQQKEFYQQMQQGKEDAIQETIRDLESQKVDPQTIDQAATLLQKDLGKVSTAKLNTALNTLIAGRLTTLESRPDVEAPKSDVFFGEIPGDILPLVSAKSINLSDVGRTDGRGIPSGTITGLSVLGNGSLGAGDNSRISFVDRLKSGLQVDPFQAKEVVAPNIGIVKAEIPRGETLQLVRPFSPTEFENIQSANKIGTEIPKIIFRQDLLTTPSSRFTPAVGLIPSIKIPVEMGGGYGNILDVTSKKIGGITGQAVNQLTTPLVINPRAGQFGQGLYIQGDSTQPIFTIPAYTEEVTTRALPFETRGTVPRQDFQIFTRTTRDVPAFPVTPEFLGTTAGKTAEVVSRFAPYTVPYLGTGLILSETGEELFPRIKESGFKQGTLRFAREEPGLALGITAFGLAKGYQGTRYLLTPQRTTLATRGPQLISEEYKIADVGADRARFRYLADRTYKIPRTFVIEERPIQRFGRGVANFFFPEYSRFGSQFKILQPKRIQVSPTIITRQSYEAPILAKDILLPNGRTETQLFLRGTVRTQRTLPRRTKFGEFRGRDVADRFLSVRVRPGQEIVGKPIAGLGDEVGKVSVGVSEQFTAPLKPLLRVRVTGREASTTTFRQPALTGGRRTTARFRSGDLQSAELFKPISTGQVVKAQRVPFVEQVPAEEILYHGTTAKKAEKILKEGLIPASSVEQATFKGAFREGSGGNIFLARTPEAARGYANLAYIRGEKPVVLQVRIPRSRLKEATFLDVKGGEYKIPGSIKPEDIADISGTFTKRKVTPPSETIIRESIPVARFGKEFDLRRYRQAAVDITPIPRRRTIKISRPEGKSTLDIYYPARENEFGFVPFNRRTGLPPPSEVLPAQRRNIIQEIYGSPTDDLIKSIPTTGLQLPTPKTINFVSTKTAATSPIVQTNTIRTGAFAGTGKYELTDGTSSSLPPVTRDLSISRTATGNIPTFRSDIRQRGGPRKAEVPRFVPFERISPGEITQFRSGERIRINERTFTRAATRQTARTQPSLRVTTRLRPPRPRPPRPIIEIPPIDIDGGDPLLRKRKIKKITPFFIPEIKRKGKFVRVGGRTATPEQALVIAARAARGELGATFRAKPVGISPEKVKLDATPNPNLYRPPKSRSPLTFVERQTRRLVSQRERGAIIQTRGRKGGNLFFT